MKVAAIIPCRKGSKGIPDKNFKEIKGKPLWKWTADAAMNANVFYKIFCSSNGGFPEGDYPPELTIHNARPNWLSTDQASLDDLIIYYSDNYPEVDVWVLLQPTSPLRTSSDILGAVQKINDYDSIVSVTSVGDKYWTLSIDGMKPLYDPQHRLNRQDSNSEILFYENGAIYVTQKWVIQERKCRIGGRVGFLDMPQERSYQVDTPFDLRMVECLLI